MVEARRHGEEAVRPGVMIRRSTLENRCGDEKTIKERKIQEYNTSELDRIENRQEQILLTIINHIDTQARRCRRNEWPSAYLPIVPSCMTR